MSGDQLNQADPTHPDCVNRGPHPRHSLAGGKPTGDKTCPGSAAPVARFDISAALHPAVDEGAFWREVDTLDAEIRGEVSS